MNIPTLLVEDHETMRETLSQFVTEVVGVNLISAVGTGEEALRRCSKSRPHLALIDVSLPGMSGIQLVRELRSRYPNVTCLMLSGHQEITYIRRALANGAQGYVLKDDPAELVDAIERVLEGDNYLSETIRDKLAAADAHGEE